MKFKVHSSTFKERKARRPVSAFLMIGVILLSALPAFAEVKVIEASNVYSMGDNDSKNDARRICVQEAKRRALELAGTYVTSLTQVHDFRLTKDEVTSYTGGMIATEVVSEEMRGTADRPEIEVRVRCSIDTSVLLKQLGSFRVNDELKGQLEAAARENEKLRKELASLVTAMQSVKDKAKAEEQRKQVDLVLSRQEANDETMKYWRRLANRVYDPAIPIDEAELAEATAALTRIAAANPANGRARFLLASIHQRNKDYTAAEKEVRSALAYSPDDPFLHLKLGALLKLDRRYDAALQELRIAEQGLGENHPGVLFNLSTTYFHMNDCTKATDYGRRYLDLVKQGDRRTTENMKKRLEYVLRECDRGELEGPRKRR